MISWGPFAHRSISLDYFSLHTVCLRVTLLNAAILDFYCRLAILSPGEIVAKTKQCCKLHCYVRYQDYCYVPSQTLMKVSCESGRGIRAEIQTFRLSPKLARDPWEIVKFESTQISRSPKDPRASLGERLNVCISARIPLPLSQLTFINVCGGT